MSEVYHTFVYNMLVLTQRTPCSLSVTAEMCFTV